VPKLSDDDLKVCQTFTALIEKTSDYNPSSLKSLFIDNFSGVVEGRFPDL
jgi:hypothetical protein